MIEQIKKNLLIKEIIYSIGIDKLISRNNLRKRSKQLIEKFKANYSGRNIIIIGNGPSLLKTDLRELLGSRTKCCLIGSNGFFNYTEKYGVVADLLCIEDPYPAEDMNKEILNYPSLKMVPYDLSNLLSDENNIAHINFRRRLAIKHIRGFNYSENILEKCYWGGTVTYMIFQIATYLKPKKIYLVGCDLSYTLKGAIKISRNSYYLKEEDNSHFCENYFKDKRYHDPMVGNMHKAFSYAYKECLKRGIEVYNCSPNTRIKTIPLLEWEKAVEEISKE